MSCNSPIVECCQWLGCIYHRGFSYFHSWKKSCAFPLIPIFYLHHTLTDFPGKKSVDKIRCWRMQHYGTAHTAFLVFFFKKNEKENLFKLHSLTFCLLKKIIILVYTLNLINWQLPFGVVVIKNVILHGHFKFLNIFTNPPTSIKMIISLAFFCTLLVNTRLLGFRTQYCCSVYFVGDNDWHSMASNTSLS